MMVTAAETRKITLKNRAKPSMASNPREAMTSTPANESRIPPVTTIVAIVIENARPSRRGKISSNSRTSSVPAVRTSSGRM